jgi:hypothetical protein
MWTPITRRHHSRMGLRYASDLTDPEWAPPGAAPSTSIGARPPTVLADEGGGQCDLLDSALGLPVAAPPVRLSAVADRLSLVCRMAGRGPVRARKPRPCDGGPGAVRARGKPVGCRP